MNATDAIDVEAVLIGAVLVAGVTTGIHGVLVGDARLIDNAAGIAFWSFALLALAMYVVVLRDR